MSDDTKFPSQLAERFQVRMPDGLRDRLRAAAEASGRSMNAEIVQRLEMSFDWARFEAARLQVETFEESSRAEREEISELRALLADFARMMKDPGAAELLRVLKEMSPKDPAKD